MPFPERIEIRGSESFFVSDDGDLGVLREVYDDRSYHLPLRPGCWFLDIGANKGIVSIYAARQGAHVIAYEPNPEAFKILLRNASLNGVFIDARCRGVWSSDAEMLLYPNVWNSGGTSLFKQACNEWTQTPIKVPLVAFDSILDDHDWDAVKIDIEGAEYEVLTKSNRLDCIKYLIVECHYWPDWPDYEKFDEMLQRLRGLFDVERFTWSEAQKKLLRFNEGDVPLSPGGLICATRRK